MKLDYCISKSIAHALLGILIGHQTRSMFFNIKQSYAVLDHVILVDVVGHHTYGRALARKAKEFVSARLARQRVAA